MVPGSVIAVRPAGRETPAADPVVRVRRATPADLDVLVAPFWYRGGYRPLWTRWQRPCAGAYSDL
jgi:hypothetical protein